MIEAANGDVTRFAARAGRHTITTTPRHARLSARPEPSPAHQPRPAGPPSPGSPALSPDAGGQCRIPRHVSCTPRRSPGLRGHPAAPALTHPGTHIGGPYLACYDGIFRAARAPLRPRPGEWCKRTPPPIGFYSGTNSIACHAILSNPSNVARSAAYGADLADVTAGPGAICHSARRGRRRLALQQQQLVIVESSVVVAAAGASLMGAAPV